MNEKESRTKHIEDRIRERRRKAGLSTSPAPKPMPSPAAETKTSGQQSVNLRFQNLLERWELWAGFTVIVAVIILFGLISSWRNVRQAQTPIPLSAAVVTNTVAPITAAPPSPDAPPAPTEAAPENDVAGGALPAPVVTITQTADTVDLRSLSLDSILRVGPPLPAVGYNEPLLSTFSLRQAGLSYLYTRGTSTDGREHNTSFQANYRAMARFLGHQQTQSQEGIEQKEGTVIYYLSGGEFFSPSLVGEAAETRATDGGLPHDPAFLLIARIDSVGDSSATFSLPDHWNWPPIAITDLPPEALGSLTAWRRLHESGAEAWVMLLVQSHDLAEALRRCRNSQLLSDGEKGQAGATGHTCYRQNEIAAGRAPLPISQVWLIKSLRDNADPVPRWVHPHLENNPFTVGWLFGDLGDHPYGLRSLLNDDFSQLPTSRGPALVRVDAWNNGAQQFTASHIFTATPETISRNSLDRRQPVSISNPAHKYRIIWQR